MVVRGSPGPVCLRDGGFRTGRQVEDPNGMNERHVSNYPPITPPSTQIYTCDNMSLRQSFSGFRKKVKDKLSKIGDKMGKGQSNVLDEEFDHSTLSLQSEPAIAVEDELRGDEVEVYPGPENSRSVSQPALEIGHSQGGSDDGASGGEVTQTVPQPRPHVQTESGPSQERREVEKSQGQELDATWRKLLDVLTLLLQMRHSRIGS